MPSFNPYLSRDYPGSMDAPFRVAETFGPAPRGHDYLDNLRMYWRRTPEAQYPDGYLGTIPSRRGDRLMDGLKARLNNKPYTRGVHKGERIDRQDYFWPPEFNQWTGLAYESNGIRFFPPGLLDQLEGERYPTDRRVGPRGVPQGQRYVNSVPKPVPTRESVLREQAPPWGVRGNPGMAVPYAGR